MPAKQKWMPDHWRSGCWVESYRRGNGVHVSRHWRSGGQVQSHYSLVNDSPNRPPNRSNERGTGEPSPRDPFSREREKRPRENRKGSDPDGSNRQPGDKRPARHPRRRTHWPDLPPRSKEERTNPNPGSNVRILDHIPLAVAPHANNAALAIALDQLGPYRVRPMYRERRNGDREEPQAMGMARIASLSWTEVDGTENGALALTLAAGSLKIPAQVRSITMQALVTHPNGTERRIELEVPVFFNADGTISSAEKARMDPEEAIRMMKALSKAERQYQRKHRVSPENHRKSGDGNANPLGEARNHNQVRTQLGGNKPEQAVQRAIAETLKLIPPPALEITRTMTIPCPGQEYVITVSPRPGPKDEVSEDEMTEDETTGDKTAGDKTTENGAKDPNREGSKEGS